MAGLGFTIPASRRGELQPIVLHALGWAIAVAMIAIALFS